MVNNWFQGVVMKSKSNKQIESPFPNHSFSHHAFSNCDDMNLENLPILPDVCKIILEAIGASEDGLTIGALKKQSQCNSKFGKLIDLGVAYLVANEVVVVERRAATGGGRGRPKKILKLN